MTNFLQVKYNDYLEEAGKFDYLRSYGVEDNDLNISSRIKNGLHTYRTKNLYDLTLLHASDLRKIRNFGKKSIVDLENVLPACHGFLFTSEDPNVPSFKNLVETGQLDDYLKKGEVLAGKRDPHWREKAGLPPKKITVAKPALLSADQLGEENHIQGLVAAKYNQTIISHMDQFNVRLDTLDNDLGHLWGRKDRKGKRILDVVGDVVMAGSGNLMKKFRVSGELISGIETGLQQVGFSLGFRDTVERDYQHDIAERIEDAKEIHAKYASKNQETIRKQYDANINQRIRAKTDRYTRLLKPGTL